MRRRGRSNGCEWAPWGGQRAAGSGQQPWVVVVVVTVVYSLCTLGYVLWLRGRQMRYKGSQGKCGQD